MIELRERFGVRRIGVFGSFARERQREDSDVDILVEVEPARTIFDLVRLSDYLSELLGRKIDLVTVPALRE